MFTFFQNRKKQREKASLYYKAAEAQARKPVFYESYGVPDTPYGRFDMIALHCFLLVRRLYAAGEPKVAQAIFDQMFKTLDLAMREMGIGDLSVPKKMKAFMQGFNGRANEYEDALRTQNRQKLKETVRRNIYGTAEAVQEAHLDQMVAYIEANASADIKNTDFTGV